MTKQELFEIYKYRLRTILRHKLVDIQNEEHKENLSAIAEKFRYSAIVLFNFYRDVLNELNFDEFGKDDLFRKPTEDEEIKYGTNLNRVLEYRGLVLPEFVDDNSSSSYIKFQLKENDEPTCIPINKRSCDTMSNTHL